ncbi:MAG: DNA-binding MarR family transcriptional regulator [Spirosomataceae bacterium]
MVFHAISFVLLDMQKRIKKPEDRREFLLRAAEKGLSLIKTLLEIIKILTGLF